MMNRKNLSLRNDSKVSLRLIFSPYLPASTNNDRGKRYISLHLHGLIVLATGQMINSGLNYLDQL